MSYVTVRGHGTAELVVKKSRFIANVAPAKSEEDAMAFVNRIRAEHKEATHNVFAYKAGTSQRLSDDGEPSGTAGRPVFDVIDKQGLSDTVVVITRYFGGILLGAGGLVHAYSQTAVLGVEAAGVTAGITAVDLMVALDYAYVGKVQYLLQQRGALILDSSYGADVVISCRLPLDAVSVFEGELAEVSAGRIQVERLQELQVGADLLPIH
ncbi:MAG: IMPACT family protein [Mycobacterium leprae]